MSAKEGGDGEKATTLQGKPLKVKRGENTLTFSQEPGGALAKPIVITYVREGAPK